MRMEINSEDICIYTYMFESLVSALTSWEGSDWFNLIFSLLTRRKTKRKGEAKRKYAFCLHFKFAVRSSGCIYDIRIT